MYEHPNFDPVSVKKFPSENNFFFASFRINSSHELKKNL
jgi:hypothetical protein